jgi:exodeoxyribonuclease VII small subunit
MAQSKKSDKELSFEDALEKLETIVSEIEGGEIPLEKSIERYAQGIELVKRCRKILDAAEEKIQTLTENEQGQMVPEGELPEADDQEQE